jgi:peptidyl-dipeptidase Dcp
MKHVKIFLLAMTLLALSGFKDGNKPVNPFFSDYKTPFQVPPFDKIDSTDFMPAFIAGMKMQKSEIDVIVNNPGEPTFANTIEAFDKSGKLLTKVSKVFFNINEANTTKQLQKIARDLDPLISKHNDDIFLNEKLFKRIKKVYENRNQVNLDKQQIRVVEKYYRDFERRGANLPSDKQAELRKVNAELSMLALTFGENLLAETNDNFVLIIDNKEDLEGLPQGVIDAAAEEATSNKLVNNETPSTGKLNSVDNPAKQKWAFTLSKPSMIPFLQYAKNRSLREKIYRGYFMRGNNNNKNDNKEVVSKIVKLRIVQSKLLGYKNYASYVIDENMAKNPETVNDFLMKLWNAAIPVAKNEAEEMQKIIKRDGENFNLEPWDWWYYAEKIHKEKYNLDESELKPYFALSNVRDGMFHVANELYGITFTKRKDLPVYQKDVEVFEVKEFDGKPLGILYLDYYPRDGKRGGAWCTDFRSNGWENGKRIDPVMSIVCNVTKPTGDTPSLLTWDEVTTLFHEFGHSLHGLFTQGKYYRTAGNVPQDYVELPSQIMENWASEPEVLKFYAKHYKTGQPIPTDLIDKIQKSGHFNQGFETVEYLAAALLDMDYHTINEPGEMDESVLGFEQNALQKLGLIPEILPRYRSTYFAHIFDGGYAAGYYVYIWAAVLDADAFDAFKKSGNIYNAQLADKFRKYCLAESGDDEGMKQYIKFRGSEPSVDPLLIRRGLK